MTTLNALQISTTAKTLGEILQAQYVVTRFSTKECIMMVSKDSTAKLVIENGIAKVYSTRDNTVQNTVQVLVDIAA